MTDAALIEELSTAPSQEWARRISRQHLVRTFLQLPKPSTADVDHYADLAGMSRRMFYRLISDQRRRVAGTFPARKVLSRGCTLEEQQDKIIALAIANVPLDSACKVVLEEVRRLSIVHGEREPSDFAVRARLRAQRRNDALSARVDEYCSIVVDACSTDLILRSDTGERRTAWLLALLDHGAYEVVETVLCLGPPNLIDCANLLIASHDRLRTRGHHEKVVGVTPNIAHHIHSLSAIAADAGYVCRDLAGILRAGEAMQLMLGREVGRIQLRPRPRRLPAQPQGKGVPLDIAKEVVTYVVQRANAVARTNHS